MSPEVRFLVLLISFLLLITTLELVRRGKLREEYSLLFLLVSGGAFLLAVFAGTLGSLANFIGIGYGPSLGFGFTFLLLLIIQIVQGVIISSLSTQNRDLAQKVAGLEWQIRQHRRSLHERQEGATLVWPEAIQKEWDTVRTKTSAKV